LTWGFLPSGSTPTLGLSQRSDLLRRGPLQVFGIGAVHRSLEDSGSGMSYTESPLRNRFTEIETSRTEGCKFVSFSGKTSAVTRQRRLLEGVGCGVIYKETGSGEMGKLENRSEKGILMRIRDSHATRIYDLSKKIPRPGCYMYIRKQDETYLPNTCYRICPFSTTVEAVPGLRQTPGNIRARWLAHARGRLLALDISRSSDGKGSS